MFFHPLVVSNSWPDLTRTTSEFRLNRVADLRSVYLSLLNQGIRFDRKLLEQSLARLGLAKLKP
jgi:hypothetical protein